MLSSGDTYSIGSTGGNSSTTLEIANLPSHNHTGTTGNQSANHTHGFSGTTSWNSGHNHNSGHGWRYVANGGHNHTFSGTTGGISANHNHSFTTSSVGSAESFSNMPPYLTINVWKRIA